MTGSARVARVVLAARAAAVQHGVAAGEARVLRDGVDVVVRLAPAPDVARVAAHCTAARTPENLLTTPEGARGTDFLQARGNAGSR